jgi:hypothetical protein
VLKVTQKRSFTILAVNNNRFSNRISKSCFRGWHRGGWHANYTEAALDTTPTDGEAAIFVTSDAIFNPRMLTVSRSTFIQNTIAQVDCLTPTILLEESLFVKVQLFYG